MINTTYWASYTNQKHNVFSYSGTDIGVCHMCTCTGPVFCRGTKILCNHIRDRPNSLSKFKSNLIYNCYKIKSPLFVCYSLEFTNWQVSISQNPKSSLWLQVTFFYYLFYAFYFLYKLSATVKNTLLLFGYIDNRLPAYKYQTS